MEILKWQLNWKEEMGMWMKLIIYEALRLSTWLSWLSEYVNWNFHKPPNADIVPVVVLA